MNGDIIETGGIKNNNFFDKNIYEQAFNAIVLGAKALSTNPDDTPTEKGIQIADAFARSMATIKVDKRFLSPSCQKAWKMLSDLRLMEKLENGTYQWIGKSTDLGYMVKLAAENYGITTPSGSISWYPFRVFFNLDNTQIRQAKNALCLMKKASKSELQCDQKYDSLRKMKKIFC